MQKISFSWAFYTYALYVGQSERCSRSKISFTDDVTRPGKQCSESSCVGGNLLRSDRTQILNFNRDSNYSAVRSMRCHRLRSHVHLRRWVSEGENVLFPDTTYPFWEPREIIAQKDYCISKNSTKMPPFQVISPFNSSHHPIFCDTPRISGGYCSMVIMIAKTAIDDLSRTATVCVSYLQSIDPAKFRVNDESGVASNYEYGSGVMKIDFT